MGTIAEFFSRHRDRDDDNQDVSFEIDPAMLADEVNHRETLAIESTSRLLIEALRRMELDKKRLEMEIAERIEKHRQLVISIKSLELASTDLLANKDTNVMPQALLA